MKLPVRGLLIIAAIVAIIATWLWIDERSRWVFLEKQGRIVEGCAVGICVGDDREEALSRLSGFGRTIEAQGGSGDAPQLSPDRTRISARDRSWRNGVIHLEIENGKVAAISWSYGGPFYVDF